MIQTKQGESYGKSMHIAGETDTVTLAVLYKMLSLVGGWLGM